jgi:hypothetical protein
MGRFTTPDPNPTSAKLSDPGTWNRYAYVGGDPVNRTDPSGQEFCDATGYCVGDYYCEGGYLSATSAASLCSDANWVPDGTSSGLALCEAYIGSATECATEVQLCSGGSPDFLNNTFFAGFCSIFGGLFQVQQAPPPPVLVVTALDLEKNCYDRSAQAFGLGGGAVLDELTYLPVNQYGQPVYQGTVTITEQNTVIQGQPISITSPWPVSAGQTFVDNVSSGGQAVFQYNQQFFVNGSNVPLQINWFLGSSYQTLGVYATPQNVAINGTYPVNKKNGTKHYCDQPSTMQVR